MIQPILDFCGIMMDFFMSLYDIVIPFVSWTFYDAVPEGLQPVVHPILDWMGFGTLSVLGFMFSVGITTYLAWQIATWILNIAT